MLYTFEGLHKCYVNLFEKVGWIMIEDEGNKEGRLRRYLEDLAEWNKDISSLENLSAEREATRRALQDHVHRLSKLLIKMFLEPASSAAQVVAEGGAKKRRTRKGTKKGSKRMSRHY